MILAIETSCDDTCAAVVTAAGEMRSNVISSQGVHDRYGGVVPEVAARHHLALINDVIDDALRTADATLDDVELVAVTQGPGWSARCSWGGHGQGPGRRARPAAGRRSTTSRATWRRTSSGRPSSRPSCAWSPRAGTPSWPASRTTRATPSSGARSTTPPARPSTRARACSGCPIPGGPALERLAAEGDPGAYDFPIAAGVAGAGLLLRRAEDGAALQGPRPGRRGAGAARRPRGRLPARDRRGARAARRARAARDRPGAAGHRRRRGGQRAAARADGRPRGRAARPERALCTDNAAMIASAARWVTPLREFALDAYASGERCLVGSAARWVTPLREFADLDAYASGERGL